MKKRMKKLMALCMSAVMVASMAACGNKQAEPEPEPAGSETADDQAAAAGNETEAAEEGAATGDETAAGEGTANTWDLSGEIKITAWNSSYTAVVEGAKQFMEMHPEAKITVEQVADNTKLYTQLAAGTGVPDIMQFQNRDNPTAFEKYAGSFLDISDLMAQYEKDIMPAVIPLLKDGDTWYSAPWDVAPALLFYRTDIFEQCGVNAEDIKTWDDYIEAGKVINEKTGGKTKMMGFDYNGTSSFDMPLIIFYEEGGSFFDENGDVQFNSDAVKTAFTIFQKMVDEDIAMNLPNEWTDRITALANDNLCTVPYGVWFAGTLKENLADQSGKWSCMALPSVSEGSVNQANSGGSTVMVSATTQYPELCKGFIEWFLLSTEGSRINMEVSTLFDAYMPAYSDESYTAVDPYFGMSPAGLAGELCAEIPDLPFPAFFTDVGQIFQSDAVGPYFVDGKDLDTVLTEATQKAQKQLEFLRNE